MTTKTKNLIPFEVKELDEKARTFEGIASTWALDLGDDVIHRGAFKGTIAQWKKDGKVLPLIDQHNYGSVRAVVGKMVDAKETKDGLWTKWEVIGGPDGDEILRRLKGNYVDGLSIGYRATKTDFEDSDEARFGEVRNIRELELHEVSVVVFPMNPGARVDFSSVKCLPREALMTLKGAVDEALDAEPEEKDQQKETLKGEGESPDVSALDRLRLRRLATPRSTGA